MSWNELRSLPDWIGKLTNLTKLELNFNQITSLPDNIGNLINLTSLYLFANPIEFLPSTLVSLRVDRYQWDRLQGQICNIQSLQYLDLSQADTIYLCTRNSGSSSFFSRIFCNCLRSILELCLGSTGI